MVRSAFPPYTWWALSTIVYQTLRKKQGVQSYRNSASLIRTRRDSFDVI